MHIGDFDFFKDFLYRQSGLALTADKTFMLDSRLTPVTKKWNYASLSALTLALRGLPDPRLVQDVVEAMTITDTGFFRDTEPFEILGTHILPWLKQNRSRKRLRIWSAGCSSGQEPYSLAMIIHEHQHLLRGWHIEIIATDLSENILERARSMKYTQADIQNGLPVQYLTKYFSQRDPYWHLKQDVARLVKFSAFNLLDDMNGLGTFDVIFCRNVLSFLDEAAQEDILARLPAQLQPDGFLFLGKNEGASQLKPVANFPDIYTHQSANHEFAVDNEVLLS